MAKAKENAKKFIVSCRVDDYEMAVLKQRAQREGVSITQLLRNCLDLAEIESRQQIPDSRNFACL